MLKLYGLLNGYKSLRTQIEYSNCLWMRIKSADWRLRNIWASVLLWCPPLLRCIALYFHDAWSKRCTDSRIFPPASRPASCICDHVPIAKNFKFTWFPQKKLRSIRARVCVSASLWWLRCNPLTEPVWSDYDSDTLCTVSDFMAAYGEGKLLTRQTTYRPSVARGLWGYYSHYQMLTTAWYCEYLANDNTQ